MPFTNKIVTFINDEFRSSALSKFAPVKYYDIASQVTRADNKNTVFPGVFNIDGEIQEVTPDDNYNIIIYHKVLSNTYSQKKTQSYGDNYDILAVTEMQLFVFAQSDKIKLTAEQLEPYIIFGLPVTITDRIGSELSLKACSINVLSSDLDKIKNFRSEYQNFNIFLAPEHIFFSVRYSIKKLFDRSCIDLCLECGQATN